MARTALATASFPVQEPFSDTPGPNGAESHAESDTPLPLEASDDEFIQVDDENEDTTPIITEDLDEPDAFPPTLNLDLDDYEDVLDVVGSNSPLLANKQALSRLDE